MWAHGGDIGAPQNQIPARYWCKDQVQCDHTERTPQYIYKSILQYWKETASANYVTCLTLGEVSGYGTIKEFWKFDKTDSTYDEEDLITGKMCKKYFDHKLWFDLRK